MVDILVEAKSPGLRIQGSEIVFTISVDIHGSLLVITDAAMMDCIGACR